MSLAAQSPEFYNPKLLKQEFDGRIGHGGYNLTVWRRENEPVKGGPVVVLASGLGDEDATLREPLAKLLATEGITTGVIRHTHRVGVANALHAREQRSQDVYAATSHARKELRPDVVILVGHSYGGTNVNDAANHELDNWSLGDNTIETVIVHEAAPGLGERPFSTMIDIGHLLTGRSTFHARKSIALAAHEITRLPRKVAGIGTTLAEVISLHGIHIVEGRERLKNAGRQVLDVFYREDCFVRPPNNPDENTVIYEGGHLESYIRPEVMASHITETVLPAVGH